MGKTTLLAALGGLLRPDSGSVLVQEGDAAVKLRPSEAVSWVLQTNNVFADRSVLDNVAVGCFADGLDGAQARARAMDALNVVGLKPLVSRRVRVLSGGEVQRTVIARALASQRPFLLADEPTGQLDTKTSEGVIDALVAAAASRGVLVVTHDAGVARRCDRVLALRDGCIQRDGQQP
jgi:putative ABC transport system ATP-binding protein/lipoprotein-releasing system ATP-binding protein